MRLAFTGLIVTAIMERSEYMLTFIAINVKTMATICELV